MFFVSFGCFFFSFSCFIMFSFLIYEYLFWLKSRGGGGGGGGGGGAKYNMQNT